MPRRTMLPALFLTATALLAAGCGDDADDDPKGDSSSQASSTDGSDGTSSPKESKSSSGASGSAGPTTPKKVTEVASKLDCDAEAGTDGFEGETEYVCGPFLIADWSTADVSEDEMFDKISEWVDEERPQWLYAGDLVIVYGTEDDLNGVADAFS